MYGLTITFAIFVCLILVEKEVQKKGLDKETLWQVVFWTILAGIIGARAYHVIDFWEVYSTNPVSILHLWQGGLGIYGAIIAGTATAATLLIRSGQNAKEWLDVFAKYIPLGQAIGRWGNYFNNEHLPYAIYESLANLILFILLLVLSRRNFRSGIIFTFYLAGYAIIRFLLEPLRSDPWLIANLNVAQVVSILVLLVAGALTLKWAKD